MHASPHILLVGGGHAMLPTLQRARAWVAQGTAVTLVDEHPYLYYSGMTPEYVGGVYDRREVRIDLAALCSESHVDFLEERAERLDPTRRLLVTSEGRELGYDLVAFDVGARNPGVKADVLPTRPLHYIERLHRRVRTAADGDDAPLRMVVAGGGAAGVEIALNVTGRFAAQDRLPRLALHVVEMADRILPHFPPAMSSYASSLLERRGVTTHLHSKISTVSRDAVTLRNGSTLSCDLVVWATGSIGPPLFREAGLPCDRNGFLRVQPTLQSPAHPCVFAAGDCATVERHEELEKVGVHAVKQGKTLRDNLDAAITRVRDGEFPDPEKLAAFTPYPAAPLILSTGAQEALWTVGSYWFRGKIFLRLKHFLDQRWMRKYNPDPWEGRPAWELFDANAALM